MSAYEIHENLKPGTYFVSDEWGQTVERGTLPYLRAKYPDAKVLLDDDVIDADEQRYVKADIARKEGR